MKFVEQVEMAADHFSWWDTPADRNDKLVFMYGVLWGTRGYKIKYTPDEIKELEDRIDELDS